MIDKHELALILERCDNPDFKEMNEAIANELWNVITETVNDKAASPEDSVAWTAFYRPAMKHGILRRLADKCRESEEGWYEVFCNAVREASEHGA